jgi:hypothetical protein
LSKSEKSTVSGRHWYFLDFTEHISTGTRSWPEMRSGQVIPRFSELQTGFCAWSSCAQHETAIRTGASMSHLFARII